MDELEALNMLLRLIGSSPVNSLDTPHPDAANAKTTLDRARRQTQRNSWWFNTDYQVTLYPDNSGYVPVPDTYSSVVFANNCYIVRGDKVYNRVTQTYEINDEVLAQVVIQVLDWDNLPMIVQDYCAYTAASQFIRDELEDPTKEQQLQQDAMKFLIDMRKQDLTENQYNIFNKSRVVQARGGVRPYGRKLRFTGTPDA